MAGLSCQVALGPMPPCHTGAGHTFYSLLLMCTVWQSHGIQPSCCCVLQWNYTVSPAAFRPQPTNKLTVARDASELAGVRHHILP